MVYIAELETQFKDVEAGKLATCYLQPAELLLNCTSPVLCPFSIITILPILQSNKTQTYFQSPAHHNCQPKARSPKPTLVSRPSLYIYPKKDKAAGHGPIAVRGRPPARGMDGPWTPRLNLA